MTGIRITSDDDLRDLAMAARIAMVQAEQDRDAQTSPTVRTGLQASVERYRALAERLEKARQCVDVGDRRP